MTSRCLCSALSLFILFLSAVQQAGAQTQNPNPPTGLQVTTADEAGISLSWSPPADDGHGAIAAYNVYRCVEDTSTCEPQWHAWLGSSGGAAYTDAAVTAGTTYRYAVDSMRYLGGEPGEKSVWSSQVTATAGVDTGREDGKPEFSCAGDENREVEGSDLITNGGFENGVSGWAVWGRAALSAWTGEGSALRVTDNNGAEQTVTGLRPNTRHTLTGSGKVAGSNAMTIGVKEHGGNEEYMQFTGSEYSTRSLVFTTGFASTSAKIYVYKYAGAGAGCGDDITLTQGSGSEYSLVWSDEFNGSGAVDSSEWQFENGFVRNDELQWYLPDNAF